MHVLRLGSDDDGLTGVRVNATVDAGNDVDAVAVDLGVTVEVAVCAEFLNDVDVDLEAVAGLRHLHVFRANTDGDLLRLGAGEGLPVDVDVVEGGLKFGTAVAKVDRETLGATKAKKVTIGVRPEDMKVATKGDGLPVNVDLVEELGADGYLYGHTEIGGKRADLVARVDGRNHPNAGETVVLTAKPGHVHAFDIESGLRLNDKPVVSA